tara:strand:+ start:222 stop:983 length:762 start_codon:yes stop_codon:yes gene_type:complete
MRFVIWISLWFLPLCLFSQANKINGVITFNEDKLEGVVIMNVSKNENTISNEKGFFILKSSIGDTLLFSYLGMRNFKKNLFKKDFDVDTLRIEMTENSIELKGVEIIEYTNINAVSLGIIPEKMKDFSQYERRLATAGDFKPIHLLSILGGSLELDPILNAINGRTKRMKYAIGLERKERNIAFLETNYTEFLSNDLKLKENEIGLLFTYLIENENLEKMITNHKKEKFSFFLIDEWHNFKKNIDHWNSENHQ